MSECAISFALIRRVLIALICVALVRTALASRSYYPVRLGDPSAIYLTNRDFRVHGDGNADDSDALQKAIDHVQETTRQGIVFVPSGTYRITRTIYVWPGVRVIGYGPTRPTLLLKAHTAGFQDAPAYMVFFAGGRPGHEPFFRPPNAAASQTPQARPPFPGSVPPTSEVMDASAGTFYSAMSNIDFEVEEGNAGAVGVRFHVAQHCFLSHMEFRMGSAYAALHDVGNEAEDLHVVGGRFGIVTGKTSPGWQFTLIDSSFENQTEAAIREHEAGMTLVHDNFRNVPTVVSIDPGYSDELWIEDSRLEDIAGPAFVVGNEENPRTQVNFENLLCRHVPQFMRFRGSGKPIAGPADNYSVAGFSRGLSIVDQEDTAEIKTTFDASSLPAIPAASGPTLAQPPAPSSWANLRDLGAKGDGVSDDTQILRKAIAEHQAIYLPTGRYLVSDTIQLRSDTVLIGLNPTTTQIVLADSNPLFDGPGAPRALLETPKDGTNIVSGIGVFPGSINSRAIGVLWKAGPKSLMDDVRFLGGHGTNNPDGSRVNPYNNTHTADPDLRKRWDAQYPSLWVNGGGGTFADIWTPDTYADAGMYISDTETAGRIFELSSEHHVRTEVRLHNVSNWRIVSLQTEEERGEGPFALPVDLDNTHHILIANLHSYRVISSYQPFPYTIRVEDSSDIRFRNLHIDSNSKVCFDAAVFDQTHRKEIRFLEIGSLDITGKDPSPGKSPREPALDFPVARLAGGFFNIAGGALSPDGDLYFVDSHWQRIYRWSSAKHQVELVRDIPIDPINIAFDKSGNLLVVSYAGNGTVYSLRPEDPEDKLMLLTSHPGAPTPGLQTVLPDNFWRGNQGVEDWLAARRPAYFLSPDGTTALPVREDFLLGLTDWGIKMADVLRSFGLAPVTSGKRFYLSNEAEEKTYSAQVMPDGKLDEIKLFLERGGESVTTDTAGNVYLAAGQVYVYRPSGALIGRIDIPERPTGLIFAKDGRTLYVLARSSLYAVEVGSL